MHAQKVAISRVKMKRSPPRGRTHVKKHIPPDTTTTRPPKPKTKSKMTAATAAAVESGRSQYYVPKVKKKTKKGKTGDRCAAEVSRSGTKKRWAFGSAVANEPKTKASKRKGNQSPVRTGKPLQPGGFNQERSVYTCPTSGRQVPVTKDALALDVQRQRAEGPAIMFRSPQHPVKGASKVAVFPGYDSFRARLYNEYLNRSICSNDDGTEIFSASSISSSRTLSDEENATPPSTPKQPPPRYHLKSHNALSPYFRKVRAEV